MTQFDPSRSNRYTGNLSVKIVIDEREVGILDSQQIVECYFIEDIFKYNLSGKLTFYDTEGIYENAPFTGNEMLVLVYGTDEIREITFHVWKVVNITQVSNVHSTTKNIIELFFVDTAFYNTMMRDFSRSFPKNTLHSDIVKHLLKNMVGFPDKDINIERSSSKILKDWVMPGWSVADSIGWLASRASGEKSGTSGYLCYNSTQETWKANFVTLNYLFSENNVIDANDFIFEGDSTTTPNKILEWWVNGTDKSTMRTVFGGRWHGIDTSKKELIKEELKFTDGLSKTVLLGKKSYFPDVSDAACSCRITGDIRADLKNNFYNEWVKRYSLQNAVNILIEGNEKRYAGHQIRIMWPSINKTTQIYDKQKEGKYLIKSITHNFTGGGRNINYMQRIVLLKNAFEDSNSSSLVKATRMNILQSTRNARSFLLGGR